jgi:hypothetical protein
MITMFVMIFSLTEVGAFEYTYSSINSFFQDLTLKTRLGSQAQTTYILKYACKRARCSQRCWYRKRP